MTSTITQVTSSYYARKPTNFTNTVLTIRYTGDTPQVPYQLDGNFGPEHTLGKDQELRLRLADLAVPVLIREP